MRGLIESGLVRTCHDVSDGGLLVAVAEMAMASTALIGARLTLPEGSRETGKTPIHGWLFGEDQARYIVTSEDAERLLAAAEQAGVPAAVIGSTAGSSLTLSSGETISISELKAAHESWLPAYMDGKA